MDKEQAARIERAIRNDQSLGSDERTEEALKDRAYIFARFKEWKDKLDEPGSGFKAHRLARIDWLLNMHNASALSNVKVRSDFSDEFLDFWIGKNLFEKFFVFTNKKRQIGKIVHVILRF